MILMIVYFYEVVIKRLTYNKLLKYNMNSKGAYIIQPHNKYIQGDSQILFYECS